MVWGRVELEAIRCIQADCRGHDQQGKEIVLQLVGKREPWIAFEQKRESIKFVHQED